MASISIFLRGMKDRPALLSFLWVATFIISLCLVFVPCWERNDDVAMSMIAHGYGLAAYSSPQLFFSNILWGYLVRVIPTVNGVLGYSLATMGVVLMFGWATLYFLVRLGAGYLIGLLAVSLLIALPTLVPQFTVNAGLLTVAAVIGWQVYARLGGKSILVSACLLAFLGYLIRDKEFLLVLVVAVPLLPWRALRQRQEMQLAFLVLSVAIVSASAFDHWSYSGQEWQHFMEMYPNLASIIDFQAGEHLKQHPEILSRHGYSQNDIDLVINWFFVDPHIADPTSLKAMLVELGSLPMQEGNVHSGFVAIKALFVPVLLPILLSALLLLILMPRWSVTLAWVLCLVALFAMGFMGRPGQLRVYVPLMSLLFVAPLISGGKYITSARQWMALPILLAACIANAYLLIPQALISKQWAQQVQRDIHGLPAGPIVIWGGDFPYELAFPVLANDLNSRKIKFYGLDGFTHAPFSVASTEQTAGREILERLRTTGIPLIASPERMAMLRIYCREHLNGQLHGFATSQTRSLTIEQVRCETT